jgi:hypothetical protein
METIRDAAGTGNWRSFDCRQTTIDARVARGVVWGSLAALSLFGFWTDAAFGVPTSFNFDTSNGYTLQLSGNYGNGVGAAAGSGSSIGSCSPTISNIETWMTCVLRAQTGNNSYGVTVKGAFATQTYSGEGHVSGLTLGTSDGGISHAGRDTFIMNDNFGDFGSATPQFTITFTGGYQDNSISFDYEIFPDATCAAGSACANSMQQNPNWPDLKILLGNSTTPFWTVKAPIPSPGTDPQALGHVTLLLPYAVTSITFQDWPAEIAIDNLRFNDVPEPGSLPLLGAACGALALFRLRTARLSRSTRAP